MSRRTQHHRNAPTEGEQQPATVRRQLIHVTTLASSGLSGAALSMTLLSHSLPWAMVTVAGLTVVAAIARRTPELVRIVIWRLALRTALREVRQFAREDLLSEKISPQDLMNLAADVHRLTLENNPAQPHDNRRNDN
ncbi:hypothetical protein [Streptomyces sp. BK205]|uniref:hypothetical protein n=1 Tax=Streptomyces TaxID=1883 RepID=UPI00104AC76E|nr:hypothetical protein [Streptomyces sp. BK205]TCR11391.1 hypothetical protein EV578_1266 [Streptomyces sp. BK205]